MLTAPTAGALLAVGTAVIVTGLALAQGEELGKAIHAGGTAASEVVSNVVNSITGKLREFGDRTRIGRFVKGLVIGTAIEADAPSAAGETGTGVGQVQEPAPQGRAAKKKDEEQKSGQ